MTHYFDRNPQSFRLLFGLIALVPLLAAAMNVYHYINAGSDDTIFADSQSRLYINTNLPGKAVKAPQKFLGDELYYSLKRGDLLLSINRQPVSSVAQVKKILDSQRPLDIVMFTVQRPTKRDHFLSFVVTRRFIPSDFLTEIPQTVYIYDVPAGGAADRAGLKVGDLIYRIDRRLFEGARAADFLVRRSLAGQKLTYDLIRDNREMTIDVTMARVQISLFIVLFQICGFLWIFVGFFLGMARPQLAAGRILALGLFFCGISFTLLVNRGYLESYWQTVLLTLFAFPSHFFGIATLFYASLLFPAEIPRLLNKQWIPVGQYTIAFGGTIACIINPRLYSFAILSFLCYEAFIKIRYRRLIPHQYKIRDRFLKILTVIALTTLLVYAFLLDALPTIWQVLMPCVTISLLLAGYLITIARYRLLGFQIKRSFQYSFVSGLWYLLLLALFVASLWTISLNEINLPNFRLTSSTIEIASTPMEEERQESLQKFAAMLLGLVLAFAYLTVGKQGLGWLRQKFHRSPYDVHKVTHELNDLMTQRLPLEDLAKGMVGKLADLMFLKQVGVLFYRDNQIVAFQEAFPSLGPEASFSPERGHELCETMKRYRSELCVDYLETDLKGMLADLGYRYVYPIHSKEVLVGLLMVGEKLSEITFRHDDFAFLSTTSRQASIAIENSFLYEVVTKQERFKQELDIARRIQLTSLPQTTPKIRGLSIAGTSLPALEVGGDFYDYYTEGTSKLTVVVGDVSGKGTSAALYMSKIQGIFRTLLQESLSPLGLFKKANPLIYKELDSASFITALGAQFNMETNTVSFSRAGHLPLAHLAADAPKAVYVDSKGMALGLESGVLLAKIQGQEELGIAPQDLFVMASDGITEAFNEVGEAFGEDRLLTLMTEHRECCPQDLMDKILSDVQQFSGSCEQHDDQTLVVIRIEPETKT